MNVQPFRFTPDPARIDDLERRLAHRRTPQACADADGRLGIAPADLTRLAAALLQLDWGRLPPASMDMRHS